MGQPVNAAAPSTAAPAGDGMMTDDQRFLLTIIFGVYFGPHLKEERPPHKSVMQRAHEGMPQYTPHQLAGSKMMVAHMMHVYHYMLRKASQSVVLAPSLLLKFFRNTLPAKVLGPRSNYPQFSGLFPTDLHPCSFVEERFMAIDNIVFIDNPSTSYLREEVAARFKSLTGLQEFILDKDATKLPIYVTDKAFYKVVAREVHLQGSCASHGRKHKSNVALDVMPLRMLPGSPSSTSPRFSGECDTIFKTQLDSKLVISPLSTTETQCHGATATYSAGIGVVENADAELTASIKARVSLAESEDRYLFQVSLPGVRRDHTFACELDMDGEVFIEGEIAIGGKVDESRHFSLCFQLPGCVNPRRSNCNFDSDGIFKVVVKKQIDY